MIKEILAAGVIQNHSLLSLTQKFNFLKAMRITWLPRFLNQRMVPSVIV